MSAKGADIKLKIKMKKLTILSLFLCFSASLFSQKVYYSDMPFLKQCTVKIKARYDLISHSSITVKAINGLKVEKSKKFLIPAGSNTFLLDIFTDSMTIKNYTLGYNNFKSGHTYKMECRYKVGIKDWGWYIRIIDVTKNSPKIICVENSLW